MGGERKPLRQRGAKGSRAGRVRDLSLFLPQLNENKKMAKKKRKKRQQGRKAGKQTRRKQRGGHCARLKRLLDQIKQDIVGPTGIKIARKRGKRKKRKQKKKP